MKIAKYYIALIAIAATLIAGCAIEPVRTDRLDKVAIITSGDIHVRALTRFGPVISIVEIDGKPVDKPYGPIDLEPGTHSVTMKCGDLTKAHSVTVAAGEVYQFAMVTTPGVKGCVGSLSRVRSAKPSVKKDADKAAQAERAKAELAKAEQLAEEERTRAALAKAEQLARMEPAKTEPAKPKRAEPGSVLTPDQKDVTAAVAAWAAAWSRKDLKGYFAAYAKNFAVPRGQSRRQWEAERRARIVGRSWIDVKIEGLAITVDGNIATARFRQNYRSDKLTETSSKTLTLVKTNRQWLIQQER